MGRFEPRAFCPGFLRGLAFRDKYAFVGLSKPRYKRFACKAISNLERVTRLLNAMRRPQSLATTTSFLICPL